MTNNLKIPTLRFPEFEWEWEEKKLGEVATFFSWWTPTSSNKEYYNWEIPFIGSWDIDLRKMNKFITKEALNSSSAKMVEEWDILYALYWATSWKVAISKIDWAINQAVLCIRTDENKFFIKTWLDKSKWNILSTYLQWGQWNLSSQIIKSLTLNLPPLPEQEKIAWFLSKVDERLEASKKEKKALEDYKKWVSQKIFNQTIRFKADDGSDFPEWEERKLGEYLKQKSIKNKDLKVALVLSVSNKKWFISQSEQFDWYKVASNDLSSYKVVNKWEYAYNPSRINVGSIARLDNFDCWIVSPMYVVFSLSEGLNNIFFDNLYQTHRFNHLIKVWCSWSVRDSLNFNDLWNFQISFPTLPEQQKIAEFLSNLDEKIEKSETEIKKLEEFKKGLLQKMFV